MQEERLSERLAAEEAAHVATEEAMEVQAAQKAKEAGNDKQTLDKSQQANLPPNLSVWSLCDSTGMSVCSCVVPSMHAVIRMCECKQSKSNHQTYH